MLPGTMPVWPAEAPFNPDGLVVYQHPTPCGYEVYQIPIGRLYGAKQGAVTSGVRQTFTRTFTTPIEAAGAGVIRYRVTSMLLNMPMEFNMTVSNNRTIAQLGQDLHWAISALIGSHGGGQKLTVGNVGEICTLTGSATQDPTLNIVEVSRTALGGASTGAAGTVAVAGTLPDFLGQKAIDGTTVKACTNIHWQAWTALN